MRGAWFAFVVIGFLLLAFLVMPLSWLRLRRGACQRVANDLEPNSYEDYVERFQALQAEAKSYGIVSVVSIMEPNPISGEDWRWSSYQGGLVTCIGMVQCLLSKMTSTANTDQIHEEGRG